MSHTKPYNIQDFGPSDLMSSDVEGIRRLKVSSEDSSVAASLNGFLYSITASATVLAGQKLALNVSLAADTIIKSASTVSGLPIKLYDEHATGNVDGIFISNNLNMLSIDESPSQGQLYEFAAAQGNLLAPGLTQLNPSVISGFSKTPSIVVENTGLEQDVFINIVFEEIGPRAPTFGLTASTFLTPSTEMSTYG